MILSLFVFTKNGHEEGPGKKEELAAVACASSISRGVHAPSTIKDAAVRTDNLLINIFTFPLLFKNIAYKITNYFKFTTPA